MEFKEIALRLTFFEDNKENLEKFITDYGLKEKVLACKEVGDTGNLHYHFYIQGNIKTIRNELRQKYKIINNLNSDRFSCVLVKDYDKYISYICKEGEIIINTLGINPEQIKEYVAIHDKIKDRKKNKSKSFFERVCDDYKPDSKIKQRRKAVEHILTFLGKKFRGIKSYDDFIVIRFINGIGNTYYPNLFMDSPFYLERILDKMGIC